jgi:hypothetical protein
MPQDVLAKRAIHIRLIAFTLPGVAPEPSYHVRIDAKRELLFEWTIEQAPFGTRPITDLRHVARVDSIVGELGKRRQLGALLRRQPARIDLPHTPSFRAASPCARS